MIPDKEELDCEDVFFQILLIGDLLTPSQLEGQKAPLNNILRQCGITLNSSEYLVLDNSRIGSSHITIARYILDYTKDAESGNKQICVEGIATIRTDELGNTMVKISSKNNPFRDTITPFSQASLVSSNT